MAAVQPPVAKKAVKIVVTGYGAYINCANNPTEAVVRNMAAGKFALPMPPELELVTQVLPCTPEAGFLIDKLWDTHGTSTDAFIHFGVDPRANVFGVERVGVNVFQPRPAVEGVIEQNVVPGGPQALMSTLPVYEIITSLNNAGLTAQLSYSAGTFYCNYSLYRSRWHAHEMACAAAGHPCHCHTLTEPADTPLVGFVHVPGLLSLQQLESGMATVVLTVYRCISSKEK